MTTLQIANGYLELHKQKQRHDSPTEGTFLHDSPTEGTFLQSERESILCKIRGQTVRIPNLFPMMAGWPADVNPHRETIKTVIDDILESYSLSAAMTNKLKRANLDFLLAVWFPYASEQALKDLTYFCGWMFLVDDEIDGVSGPGFDNEKAFAALYRGTLGFVERSLDLGGQVSEEDLRCANATAESFGRIGEALCEQYSVGQREMFLKEAKLTLDGYRFEQQLRLRGQLPSFAEYWAYREGSCCCRQTVAMLEFANDLHIPHEVMQTADMRSLWKEAALIHWITNDIVSAKKEIAENFIENLVALCSGPAGTAQIGMDTAVDLLQGSIDRFELAVSNLSKTYGCGNGMRSGREMALELRQLDSEYSPEDLARAIEVFIANCRCMCVGNLQWSLESPRYGLQTIERDAKGGITYVVGH